ncbi:hypothetical protein GUJ93_ZPchr0009g2024 [Zizania palustris]|uniref:Myb/SANT-like DNA-binding domain-containing protein n=1 Tax=Zizania palustris TaxID=103762 RepID=A0A8J5RKG8_ZIZPA|nr:hypothetical protein GUJ93_ZPchr0009g2024 [Zizania palustris]KAG8050578.1 hypothetical protein GUJ93_ZPchr0009g2024 [Zizania palustris]
MEGNNLPSGNLMEGTPYATLDLHCDPMQMHAPNPGDQGFDHTQMPGNFLMHVNQATDSDQLSEFRLGEPGKAHHHHRRTKNRMSDEEEHGLNEDTIDSQSGKGKKGSAWQRMKWTDLMVKLLITAVSYTGEDPAADSGGGKRNSAVMLKKGKWKAISKVMGERGCNVSPQQCEDKFNDLNKRYKRLTDILGRGTACKIVENHALLDCMDNLPEKMKDDARKILSSKHLFYEEMCSYHNNNRVSLPEDPALQHSLQLALRCKEEHDLRRGASGDADEDDQSADTDYEEENDEEHHTMHGDKIALPMHKRLCHMADQEDVGFGNSSSSQGCSRRSDSLGITLDINKAFPDGTNLALAQKDLATQSEDLEEQRLRIEVQALDLAKQRLNWERFSKKKDRELEQMRLENEKMKIENRRLELEVRHKELELELKQKGSGNHV